MTGFSRKRSLLIVATLGAFLLTGVANAEPTAADRETARSLMQEGRDLREKGRLQDALKRFKAADDIMHVPTTGLELARTQAAMGLLLEARDTIANIRKTPASSTDPEPFKDARAKAEELDTSLESKIPALTIVVQGAADGETPTVVVDGSQLPAAVTGLPRRVNAGHHTIVARTATEQGEQTVDVKEGERKDVQITLSPVAKTEALSASESAGAAQPEHPTEAGTTSHSPTPLTFAGIGVAGAGLIAGTVTGLMSLSKTSALKTECPMNQCTTAHNGYSDRNTAFTLATVSDIGFVAAGVGAAAAVATLIIGHEESPSAGHAPETQPSPESPASNQNGQSRLRVVPWVGLGSAGVSGVF
jgi:hypothetical protein